MQWMKIAPACAYLGGISAKTLYAAVRRGDCKAAHIGAGRNLLFSDQWLNEYAEAAAEQMKPQPALAIARKTA